MAISKSSKQWFIAVILILAAVLIIDWFVNRNRTPNSQTKESIQHGINK